MDCDKRNFQEINVHTFTMKLKIRKFVVERLLEIQAIGCSDNFMKKDRQGRTNTDNSIKKTEDKKMRTDDKKHRQGRTNTDNSIKKTEDEKMRTDDKMHQISHLIILQ